MRIAATKTDTASPVPQSPIAKQAVWPGMQLAQQASDYWLLILIVSPLTSGCEQVATRR
jgi:hypothetical protein